MKRIIDYLVRKIENSSFKTLMMITVSVLTFIILMILTFVLYNVFEAKMLHSVEGSSKSLLDQCATNMEEYLRNMRQISDTLTYNVIKATDLDKESIVDEMNLLYEANKDNLVSIACFEESGNLIGATPYATKKKEASIVRQKWFLNAVSEQENIHFSAPHVQNLFNLSSFRYYWVISLSRSVEITDEGKTKYGVLVIDMNYSSIEQMFESMNQSGGFGYSYLMDAEGNIIYHPKASMINANLFAENNEQIADYSDGAHMNTFQGEDRMVVVKSVSYTGWKIVNVIPSSELSVNLQDTRYLIIIFLLLTLLLVIFLNNMVSMNLFKPLDRLTESVEELDEGNANSLVYVGGTKEVSYLGRRMNDLIMRLRRLNDLVVLEQEEKRKAELDALQSQINPHFLYNTLDSIIWMIEGEFYQDAIFMIKQLASLFRVSLSKGKTMITIENEILHAKNYMNIQKVRYRNKFDVTFDIDPEILPCRTVKLIIQPLLENSLYYAVEAMDGDGEIEVRGYRDGDDIYIHVIDDGMGMTPEVVEGLLDETKYVRKRGSGVGLINVDKRIKIRFGQKYGLKIESEVDEGTCVTIHLPYQPFEEENP